MLIGGCGVGDGVRTRTIGLAKTDVLPITPRQLLKQSI